MKSCVNSDLNRSKEPREKILQRKNHTIYCLLRLQRQVLKKIKSFNLINFHSVTIVQNGTIDKLWILEMESC